MGSTTNYALLVCCFLRWRNPYSCIGPYRTTLDCDDYLTRRRNGDELGRYQQVKTAEYGEDLLLNRRQPYKVVVGSIPLLIMDFHAHLSKHETSGMLAGTYDVENR